eukprot:CAMPEP_0172377288 /NCGR_PEP_ID=MMETSP1060-20121228/68829_1 /TAXON_ID=37318 /ORGANISM="Pseudo-nitzschia pungens, Strain cf. cingulata" /LENGTH=933 /DNA_ID=CAMNT_0013104969 /DNA_START=122 /DNA_END=2923 /DNA_ORIENTATION=-
MSKKFQASPVAKYSGRNETSRSMELDTRSFRSKAGEEGNDPFSAAEDGFIGIPAIATRTNQTATTRCSILCSAVALALLLVTGVRTTVIVLTDTSISESNELPTQKLPEENRFLQVGSFATENSTEIGSNDTVVAADNDFQPTTEATTEEETVSFVPIGPVPNPMPTLAPRTSFATENSTEIGSNDTVVAADNDFQPATKATTEEETVSFVPIGPVLTPVPTLAPSTSEPSTSPAPTISNSQTSRPTKPDTIYVEVSTLPTARFPTLSPSLSLSSSPTISNAPTITGSPTPILSSAPSFAPTHFPSISPTVSPTWSPAPTISPAPSNYPTNLPSSVPTDFPSTLPSAKPSISLYPSPSPSISLEPTLSLLPSSSPSVPPTTILRDTATELNIVMIMTNVPKSDLSDDERQIWESVTDDHVKNFYQKSAETFPDDWPMKNIGVKTYIVGEIFATETMDYDTDDDATTESQPEKQTSTPAPVFLEDDNPAAAVDAAEPDRTFELKITYNQTITAEFTDRDGKLNDHEDLFVLPFSTDSFTYSVQLKDAMGWQNRFHIEIEGGERETAPPTGGPTKPPRLTTAQTIAISASIVMGACLIVVFLLWDRTQKGDGRNNDPASPDAGSSSSSVGMRPPYESEKGKPIEFSRDNRKNTEDYDGSTRSAPAHLRRGEQYLFKNNPFAESRKEEGNHKGTGTHKSRHVSKDSENSVLSLRDKSFRSITPEADSPKTNSNDKQSIPKQLPRSIRAVSAGEYLVSTSASARGFHHLPPLPPQPSGSGVSGSSTTNEEPRRQSFDHTRRSSGDSMIQLPPPAHYQRRRPPPTTRVSSISDDSMTEISMLTSTVQRDFGIDGEFGAPTHVDFPPPIPDHDIDEPSEAFRSPLHIPHEDGHGDFGSMATRPESPIPTTMLGLAPMSMANSILTPSQTGFDMKIRDIE